MSTLKIASKPKHCLSDRRPPPNNLQFIATKQLNSLFNIVISNLFYIINAFSDSIPFSLLIYIYIYQHEHLKNS